MSLMTALPVIGNLASGAFSAFSSSSAADEMEDELKKARKAQESQYYDTRADLDPWMDVGRESLFTMADLLGLGGSGTDEDIAMAQAQYDKALSEYNNMAKSNKKHKTATAKHRLEQAKNALDAAKLSAQPKSDDFGSLLKKFDLGDFEQEPGYQFRLNEGNKAINASNAARGSFFSGQAMKDLLKYGQDYASNEYGNAWNRDAAEKQRIYNMLAGPSGTGQTTATTLGNFGANNANQIAENYLQGGNVRASGIMGVANSLGSGVQNAYDAYSMSELLKKLPSSAWLNPDTGQTMRY